MKISLDTQLEQAKLWAYENYTNQLLETGESMLDHALGMRDILHTLNPDTSQDICCYLYGIIKVYERSGMSHHDAVIRVNHDWGSDVGLRVKNLHELMSLGAKTWSQTLLRANDMPVTKQEKSQTEQEYKEQLERVRKLLLAMAHDIRVVFLRLASRLQTLRYFTKSTSPCPNSLALETLELYSPLANRLGIWQIKWELEDLAFRFAKPTIYRQISKFLDEKRSEREIFVDESRQQLESAISKNGIQAKVSGRPKHIYSIYNKMHKKGLEYADLYDIRAFRIIVEDLKDCYSVLGVIHHIWQPIPKEFDDYIARPKPNGYQSLHTVVVGDDGRPIEIQIRTTQMHEFAEYGVAAHWRYKEGKDTKSEQGQNRYDAQIAAVRQLITWQSDMAQTLSKKAAVQHQKKLLEATKVRLQDPHIYVLTPEGKIIELPSGSTAVDFAYHVHTNVGHMCRGAKINGLMLPLNTRLENGQTVQIITVKTGGPSRDWMKDEFTNSPRAKNKIRAWFNAQATQDYQIQGRTEFERELARLGKTSVKHDEVAHALGLADPENLYISLGKGDVGLHMIESYFSGLNQAVNQVVQSEHQFLEQHSELIFHQNQSKPKAQTRGKSSGVLVVGLDDLLSQLAQCCKPAPPDDILGFVTRGKGISIHRKNCDNFLHMQVQHAERVLPCTWAECVVGKYSVDILVLANEPIETFRQITEVLAKEKIQISSMKSNFKGNEHSLCEIILGVEVENTHQLSKAIKLVGQVDGVDQVLRI